MSVAPVPVSIRTAIEGRWQIPLLVVSLGLLVAGLFLLRPSVVEPSYPEQVAEIEALVRGRLYGQAASWASKLLEDPDRPDAERAELHGLLGRISFLRGARQAQPDPAIAHQTIEHYTLSIRPGRPLSSEALVRVAQAHAWLGETHQAIASYRAALAAGSRDPLRIHRTLYELGEKLRPYDEAAQRAHLDEIIELAGDSPADLLWAVTTKAERLLEGGRAAEAKAFVEAMAERFAGTALADEYEYLRARCRYALGEFAEAARMLTALRQRVNREVELAARAGWLLGRTNLGDGRPQAALLEFDEVIRLFPGGPWHAVSLIGRAEAQVALGRYAQAAESYRKALAMPVPETKEARFDREVIRTSLTTQYEVLNSGGQPEAALRFLELAGSLVPDTDERRKPFYASQLAALHTRLATALRKQAEALPPEKQEALRELHRRARGHLSSAARHLLLYSTLTTKDALKSAAALLEAAERFDQAGDAERAIDTLELFLKRWPASGLAPKALFRLGQRLQAAGQYTEAIEAYERNLSNYPRTPAAFQSYLPLAESYLALGEKGAADAERTLLRVVSPAATESLFTPEAEEYRGALFRLGELYSHQGRYEDAVTRFEEAIQRYPQDLRIVPAKFMLANAYRRSALALRSELTEASRIGFRERMRLDFAERMERARRLFKDVVEAIRQRPSPLSPKDELYFQLATFYQADCLFDLKRFEEALSIYEEAAWTLHDQARALSAYVQIIRCYIYLGRPAPARAALSRARQIARKIPAEDFERLGVGPSKQYWESFLAWVGRSGMF